MGRKKHREEDIVDTMSRTCGGRGGNKGGKKDRTWKKKGQGERAESMRAKPMARVSKKKFSGAPGRRFKCRAKVKGK